MAISRFEQYQARMRNALRVAFDEDHPPHHVAASFAVGVFFTVLPSAGAALVLLVWMGYQFEWANKLALLAAVAVVNPLAKTGVYAMAFVVGTVLLGPIPGITRADVGLDAGFAVFARLLVGTVILAFVFAALGYVVAYRAVREYRRRAS